VAGLGVAAAAFGPNVFHQAKLPTYATANAAESTQRPVGFADLAAVAVAERSVLFAVPYAVHDETLRKLAPALRGKILVDMVVPLAPGNRRAVAMPPEGTTETPGPNNFCAASVTEREGLLRMPAQWSRLADFKGRKEAEEA
jgi:predicted dinucleotide-binding enzyme